jgi:hypothetical protein
MAFHGIKHFLGENRGRGLPLNSPDKQYLQMIMHTGTWLIDWLLFYVLLKNISLTRRRHHCRWRATKFRPMLNALGLWAGRDLHRATPAVTRDLGFSGLIRRTAPFSRLFRHTRGCGESILTRILTVPLFSCLLWHTRRRGETILIEIFTEDWHMNGVEEKWSLSVFYKVEFLFVVNMYVMKYPNVNWMWKWLRCICFNLHLNRQLNQLF